MSPTPRCLVADVDDPTPLLDRGAVHHFERVLRLSPGEAIELVDGRGGLAHGHWGRKGQLTGIVVAPRCPAPTSTFVLAVAPPRLPRLDWLVEKATELGVSRLQLLQTRHAARDVSAGRLERLRRKADEAMLQCRRLWRMEIPASASLTEVLGQWTGAPVWCAQPGATCPPLDVDSAPRPAGPLLGLVGPEGGWHVDELARARDGGARIIGLGDGVLRVETAALALAVLAALRQPTVPDDDAPRPAR